MKNSFLVIACFILIAGTLSSCGIKDVQKKVEDLVVQVMTDGVWLVTKYEEGTDDQTTLFQSWESQFFDNRTCTVKNIVSGVVVPGTWDGSYANQTMTGYFGNQLPINKMNGTWKIIRSSYTVGEFQREVNGVTHKLTITKK